MVTIRLSPMGPLSLVELWRSLYVKSEVERQREERSIISSGESLVRRGRSLSFLRRLRMWLRQSAIGTEGNRAAASKDTIFSLGLRVKFLIFSTNENEFFITYGLLEMKG